MPLTTYFPLLTQVGQAGWPRSVAFRASCLGLDYLAVYSVLTLSVPQFLHLCVERQELYLRVGLFQGLHELMLTEHLGLSLESRRPLCTHNWKALLPPTMPATPCVDRALQPAFSLYSTHDMLGPAYPLD